MFSFTLGCLPLNDLRSKRPFTPTQFMHDGHSAQLANLPYQRTLTRHPYSIFQESRRVQPNAPTGSTNQPPYSPANTSTQPYPRSTPHQSPKPIPTHQTNTRTPSHKSPQSTQRDTPTTSLRGGGSGFTEQDLEDLLEHARRNSQHSHNSTRPVTEPPTTTRPGYGDEEKARMASELRAEGVPRFLSLEPWRRLDETLGRMRERRGE